MNSRFRTLLLTALVVTAGAWCSPALAQAPYLVKDINTTVNSQPGSNPGPFVSGGGVAYFRATEPAVGAELWKTDGTAAGTVLVKDLTPGPDDSYFNTLTLAGGTLYFTMQDASHGTELWKSDGTAAGTALVKDINPGPDGSYPAYLTDVAGTLYFSAFDPTGGSELWKTDGTEAGTVRVADLVPGVDGSNPGPLYAMGSALFFSAFDPATGQELWKSDGTAAGTVMVADIEPGGGGSYPNSFAALNGTLFFNASDSTHGAELWMSDGTAAGTVLVQDLVPGIDGSFPSRLTQSGGVLFFMTYNSASSVSELYTTDGTIGGAVLVKGGFGYGSPSSFTDLGGTLLFTALNYTTFNDDLWRSDGTTAGTVAVSPAPGWSATPDSLITLNGTLYLSANDPNGPELWKSDGTQAGTAIVRDIVIGPLGGGPAYLTGVGATLLFAATDPETGAELWKSDGTEAGTVLLKDINEGDASSFPSILTDLGGTLIFTASDATTSQLWKSDGTQAGTIPVSPGANFSVQGSLKSVNGALLFAGQDSDHGTELFRTDGTAAGSYLVKDIDPGTDGGNPFSLVTSGGLLYFSAFEPDHGSELWKSDGTEAGTMLVKDLAPGPAWGSPQFLTDVNGTLFFSDGVTLWKSDGTEAGTVSVSPRVVYIIGGTLTNVNGIAFFTTFNYDTYTYDLWNSDGTDPGTVLVKGGFDYLPYWAGAGANFFFINFSYATFTYDLWKSDGTEAGTTPVSPGAAWSNPASLFAVNGTLFFTAFDPAHGTELYSSDGTEAGTGMVRDISPGPDGSDPVNFASINGALYFGASDGTHGRELWKSDGTEAGTTLQGDIAPGPLGSNPHGMTASGARIYLAADGAVFGEPRNTELWAISPCSLPDDNCNGIDEDCNGIPDDGYVPQATACGVGACSSAGVTACVGGVVQDSCLPGSPAVEVCDTLDNDCDGQVDEDFPGGCPCVMPGNGLVGWWPGDGDARDMQGGNDGTLNGPVEFAAGRVGPAFKLNGSAFVSDIGTVSSYSFIQNTGVFSIVAWILLDDPAALLQQGIVGNTSTTAQKGHFFIWENLDGLGRLRVGIMGGTPGVPVADVTSAPHVITTSGWHHVAAVGDGTAITFYVDGIASPGTGTIGTLSTGDSTNPFVIGGCGLDCAFRGQIDEVQIYDRALDGSEILANDAADGHGLCRCTDADGDGYGVEGNPSCPAGMQSDCDDSSAAVHAGAPDSVCNGVDDDCDGLVDEDSPWTCQCTLPGSGIVSWWPGDGDALDIRGGHHGTLEGGTTFAPGVVGQAFRFDGVQDSVDGIGDASTYSFMQDTGVFTIDAWISLDDPDALVDQAITANAFGGGNTGHIFRWENSAGDQKLHLHLLSGTPGTATALSFSPNHVITTTGWHHVAVVADGGRITFYVDGIAYPGTGVIGALASGDSSGPLVLGAIPGYGPEKFGGLIDELHIWNRALATSEIQALIATGGAGPCRCTDADGDGYGIEGGLSCPRGPLQDCDAGNPAVWGAPFEVLNLYLASSVPTGLAWDDQAGFVGPGVTYDLLRGPLNVPAGSAGDVCTGPAVTGTAAVDGDTPSPGTGFWYLVRGHNTCGAGTYGNRSSGAPRSSSACP